MFQKGMKLFKKGYLINQLMFIYGLLLTGIILLTVASLCVYTTYSSKKQLVTQTTAIESQVRGYAVSKNDAMLNIYSDLAGNNSKVENMRNYLMLPLSDYLQYTIDSYATYRTDINFVSTLATMFGTYPDLETLYIQMADVEDTLRADRTHPNGRKISELKMEDDGLVLKRSIQDYYSGKSIGMIWAVFSESGVLDDLAQDAKDLEMTTLVFDNNDDPIYSRQGKLSKKELLAVEEAVKDQKSLPSFVAQDYFVSQQVTISQNQILLLTSKQHFWRRTLGTCLVIVLIGTLLALLLLLTLRRTFKRYSQQVGKIVAVTENVSQGNLKDRIDATQVQDELNVLAEAINFMIESMDHYIEDIYTLEVKQRDANMRALQSQINPHFLYNTLEYIRMYALSRQQEELADVVYAFSALLRNNTTQEKTTTIEKELSFCEKYVYLYQMRYPDQIAYHFELAEGTQQVEIPKFTIQPLIENYFVHGIDYTRNDNAISVKTSVTNGELVILIRDNGKGMTPTRLAQVRNKLAAVDVEMSTSIGLRNVHERLKSFFGEQYELTIDSTLGEGTTIQIKVKGEGGLMHV
ncbi:two-component system, sensor histidine kinase YesM [Enterococcus diestrammenae]|uniref:Two-component system, sensor histidine kinase YesM n=2 Tax=Enterococcus TaxID=1350 RepID=A0ABV0F3Q3_9ENTE|nr:two-component sensor histidine kinase [Enterococcus diestrammenae]